MIVRRQQTDAIKSGDADLDATYAHRVGEHGQLWRAGIIGQRTLSFVHCPAPLSSKGLALDIAPGIDRRLALRLHAVVPQGVVQQSSGAIRIVPCELLADPGTVFSEGQARRRVDGSYRRWSEAAWTDTLGKLV